MLFIGSIVDSSALIIGGVIGAFAGGLLPIRVRQMLPLMFGLISSAIGINLINQVSTWPVVVLAVVIGSAMGELTYLEAAIARLALKVRDLFNLIIPSKHDMDEMLFKEKFVALLVLFCASGMGVIGAMTEGITGSPSILFVKAILDFSTALIFATVMGYSIASIAILQFLVQSLLVMAGSVIVPFTNDAMIGDFSSVGGIIMLATGLRLCEIKTFPVANMLPALIIVMPLHALWVHFL